VKSVCSEDAPAPVGPYSQAVVRDGLVFVSGQIPLDPATGHLVTGDIETQVRRVLENLHAVLRAAGSELGRVLRTTIYLTDLDDFQRVNAVYAEFFADEPQPARSTVQVAALPLGARVEVDCIAHV